MNRFKKSLAFVMLFKSDEMRLLILPSRLLAREPGLVLSGLFEGLSEDSSVGAVFIRIRRACSNIS